MNQRIREDIFQRVEELFAKEIADFETVHRGLLNLKWIVTFDDRTTVFVKQYHPARYSGKLSFVKTALSIQEAVQKQGIRCPKIHSFDGGYLMTSSQGEVFTVLETMSGSNVPPGQAGHGQMFSLGRELGKLHQALSAIPPTPLYWTPDKARIRKKWENQMSLALKQHPSARVICMLHKQKEILDTLDFSLFEECRKGWAHWDMHMDNVLFEGGHVSAILDFDRMRYVYPDLDVARAVLSGCFSAADGMNGETVTAFLNGYREMVLDYGVKDFVRALRLLWTKESGWWITADIEGRSANPQRFFEEIAWLQENWNQLDDMLR
ncbi:phosphotransferase [Laceyella putida]|uniref:Phosphotransferase n=1 Tax=Laceyella putida TaxID=110101 RepID=A0ABW2RLQ2_9BACL